MKKIVLLVILLSSLSIVLGCRPSGPSGSETPLTSDSSTENDLTSDVYPAPQPTLKVIDTYPVESDDSNKILLAMDKPISTSDSEITGVGPAGLNVSIVNITFMGEFLGSGVIEEDGTFAIEVENLQSGIRIGLAADVSSQGLSEDDIKLGDGAISVPQIGNFFDSAILSDE